jgi:H+/Cl- antiporter ClcA
LLPKYRVTIGDLMTSHPPRRLLLLCALAAGLGLAAGGVAWVLIKLIAVLTNLALFHRWGTTLADFRDLVISPWVVIAAVAGATIVTLLARWAPIIRGHGIPEAMDAVLTRRSKVAPRTAVAKPLSAAVAIGTGGPFGAEGPIIVTGGALGSLVGQVLHVSASERKILLACGAAAGMAATFGTPLAAVVLAIELLLFEFSPRAFIPLVVSTSVAGGVHAVLFGNGPLFHVPEHGFSGLGQLPLFALLGVGCGLLAVLISRGLFLVEDLFHRLPFGVAWHPIVGAVAWASLGLLVPRALGVGYDVIDDALAGRLAMATLAALAVGKLVIWWIALASGTSGGTLAPILLISSCSGALVGELLDHAFPHLGISPSAFALVAMAATFGAAARAPFAAIVFLFELTRDYDAILPLMLATVLADLVARSLVPHSIMTEKLARRGVMVPSSYHVDPLATTRVREVMSTDTRPGLDAVVPGAAAVHPDTTLHDALALMIDDGVDQVAVVADGAVVGVCSRSDVLRARVRQLDLERTERGWLASTRIPRRRAAREALTAPDGGAPS